MILPTRLRTGIGPTLTPKSSNSKPEDMKAGFSCYKKVLLREFCPRCLPQRRRSLNSKTRGSAQGTVSSPLSVAEHSASSCLKFSHGSGSRFIASLLHPLTRWVSPLRMVSRSFLPDCLLRPGLMWFVCDFFRFLFAVILLCAWVGWT